eukprot:scaffold17398_cov155-Skeletonema_marinoi.AAC.13
MGWDYLISQLLSYNKISSVKGNNASSQHSPTTQIPVDNTDSTTDCKWSHVICTINILRRQGGSVVHKIEMGISLKTDSARRNGTQKKWMGTSREHLSDGVANKNSKKQATAHANAMPTVFVFINIKSKQKKQLLIRSLHTRLSQS